MDLRSHFPADIEKSAFRLANGEYSWQLRDLPTVFAYCTAAGLAIVGGEAWVVRRVDECGPDDPTEPVHSLDPHRGRRASVLSRSKDHVIFGQFLCRDGNLSLFTWETSAPDVNESWSEHVAMTLEETRQEIHDATIEADIIPEYAPYVYYKLVFERQDGEIL